MFVAGLLVAARSDPLANVQRRTRGSDLRLAPPGEAGELLELTGRLFWKRDSLPFAGAPLLVYHADSHGEYVPRLRGVLHTDSLGSYRVRTILPGGYGGGAPHIHFEMRGPDGVRRMFWLNVYRTREDSARFARNRVGVDGHGSLPENASEVVALPDRKGVRHCTWDIIVSLGFAARD
jgi:hypothetical protein